MRRSRTVPRVPAPPQFRRCGGPAPSRFAALFKMPKPLTRVRPAGSGAANRCPPRSRRRGWRCRPLTTASYGSTTTRSTSGNSSASTSRSMSAAAGATAGGPEVARPGRGVDHLDRRAAGRGGQGGRARQLVLRPARRELHRSAPGSATEADQHLTASASVGGTGDDHGGRIRHGSSDSACAGPGQLSDQVSVRTGAWVDQMHPAPRQRDLVRCQLPPMLIDLLWRMTAGIVR